MLIPLTIEKFNNINFAPGILFSTPISALATTKDSDPKQEAKNYYLEMAKTDNWKRTWIGISYHVAATAYTKRISHKPEMWVCYSASVWTVDDIPSAEDEEYIRKYYNA